METSQVTIHMVCSLDGFIARPDGDVSWMQTSDHYENGKTLSEQEIAEFLSKIDCYVMGARTYEHALKLGWPYGDKPVVVVSSKALDKATENVEFYSGSLSNLVKDLRAEHKEIWMVGGAELTRSFIHENLADKIVVSVLPVLLGSGIPFFKNLEKELKLSLKDSVTYKDGMVELTYQIT